MSYGARGGSNYGNHYHKGFSLRRKQTRKVSSFQVSIPVNKPPREIAHIDQTSQLKEISDIRERTMDDRRAYSSAIFDADLKKAEELANRLNNAEKPLVDRFNDTLKRNYKHQPEFYRSVGDLEPIGDYEKTGIVRSNPSNKTAVLSFSTDARASGEFGAYRMVFDANSMRNQVKPMNYLTTEEHNNRDASKQDKPGDFDMDNAYAMEQELRSYVPVKAILKRVEIVSGNLETAERLKAEFAKQFPDIPVVVDRNPKTNTFIDKND